MPGLTSPGVTSLTVRDSEVPLRPELASQSPAIPTPARHSHQGAACLQELLCRRVTLLQPGVKREHCPPSDRPCVSSLGLGELLNCPLRQRCEVSFTGPGSGPGGPGLFPRSSQGESIHSSPLPASGGPQLGGLFSEMAESHRC